MSKIKLFISYCQERSISEKVLSLADKLRVEGVDCEIDQYNTNPKEGWQIWMLRNVKKADFVLVVCTRDYYDNFLDGHKARKGSKFEGVLLLTDIYQMATSNDKYIPVIFKSADKKHIPDFLKSYTYYNLQSNKDYEGLYRRITDQPKILKPSIGDLENYATGVNLTDPNSRTNLNAKQEEIGEVMVDSPKIEIEIKIDRNLEDFTKEDEQRFLAIINAALQNSDGIKIKKKRIGSTILTLELNSSDYNILLDLIQLGLLDEFNVIDINRLDPPYAKSKISILLVDDHKLIRDSWKFILDGDPRFSVIGETGSGEVAIEIAKTLRPDIVLMDVNMSPVHGFDSTRQIIRYSPASKVIAVSMHTMPAYAKRMMQLGAMGYVTKNSSKEEMIKAILEVSSGGKYISEEITNLIAAKELEEEVSQDDINTLSRREIDIIHLIKQGMSSKEIAQQLDISLKTVEVHRYNILKKLKLKNTHLINFINIKKE